MKPSLINDPFHNPFRNRFRVPVHSRLDEMQSYTHMAWLSDSRPVDQKMDQNQQHWGRALAGAFALILVVVVFSVALLSN